MSRPKRIPTRLKDELERVDEQLQLETPHEPYGQALLHPCPRCGAGPWNPCTTSSGWPAAEEHAARLKYAALRKESQ